MRIITDGEGMIGISEVIKLLQFLKVEYETGENISPDYTEYLEVQ